MKISTSKVLTIVLLIFGCAMVVAYYQLVYLGFSLDSSIGVAAITEVIATILGYLIYNLKLKDSRNKYGVDQDGVPWSQKESEYQEEDSTDDSEEVAG